MPYADTDFFLALLKENGWLGKKAEKVLNDYKGGIWTSQWTLVELLLLSKKYGMNPEIVVVSAKEIASKGQ